MLARLAVHRCHRLCNWNAPPNRNLFPALRDQIVDLPAQPLSAAGLCAKNSAQA